LIELAGGEMIYPSMWVIFPVIFWGRKLIFFNFGAAVISFFMTKGKYERSFFYYSLSSTNYLPEYRNVQVRNNAKLWKQSTVVWHFESL